MAGNKKSVRLEGHRQNLINQLYSNIRQLESMTVEELYYFENDLENQKGAIEMSDSLSLLLNQVPLFLSCKECQKCYGNCDAEENQDITECCKQKWMKKAAE